MSNDFVSRQWTQGTALITNVDLGAHRRHVSRWTERKFRGQMRSVDLKILRKLSLQLFV